MWHLADRLGLRVAWALLLIQGLNVLGYCRRFPVMDEMSNFEPNMLGRELSAHYLFGFQNEHGILLTRLLTWGLYRAVDGNPVVHTACNYAIFLGACLLLRSLLKQLKAPGSDILMMSAALPIAWEVHGWPFQTHFYATFATFLGALWALSRRDGWAHLAGPLAIIGCLSFSAGVAFACALFGVAITLATWQPARRGVYWGVAGACAAGVGLFCALSHAHVASNPATAAPWNPQFWRFASVHLGGALGWRDDAARDVGAVLLAAGLVTLALFARRAVQTREVSQLVVTGLMAGILGSLALTALGRAGLEHGTFVHNRYTTYTLFFALTLWAMQAVLWRGKSLYLAALAVVFLAQMVPRYNFKSPYRAAYEHNLEAQRCARAYYLGENTGDCSELYPGNAADYLDAMWRAEPFAIKELKRLHAGARWRYDVTPDAAPRS